MECKEVNHSNAVFHTESVYRCFGRLTFHGSTSYMISLQPPPILNTSLSSVSPQALYNIDRKEGDFMLCIILVGLVTILVTAKVGIPLVLCLKELNKKTG